jgi:uncharacterized membrane protein
MGLPAAGGLYLVLALVLGLAVPSAEVSHVRLSPMASASVIAILTSVASGMMALTAIVFSIIFLGIQFGATAYSPRLTGELARRPLLGHALGVFSGTFVYCIVALRSVDLSGTTGVGRLVVGIAVAWLLASVVLLVMVAAWPQAMILSRVLDEIGRAGIEAVADLDPDLDDGAERPRGQVAPAVPEDARITHAIRLEGPLSYLQTLRPDKLTEAARRAGGTIVISRAVGDPIAPGETVAVVLDAERAVSGSLIRSGLRVGRARRMRDDPRFALRLLVDVAIRALSPAVNDPTTAVEALDEVERLLIVIGRSRFDDELLRDAAGQVRVVRANLPTWEDVLALALLEVQQYGRDSYQVQRRIGVLLRRLTAELPPVRRPAVAGFAQRHHRVIAESFAHEDDRTEATAEDPQGLGHTLPPTPS